MKPMICYLYEYENDRQVKNVGFIKCILKQDNVTFQIHGKGLECDKFMDLEMFLFTSKQEYYEVDRAGNVEGVQGTVNYMVTVDAMDSDRMHTYDGVMLESVNHKYYVATWKQKKLILKNRKEDTVSEEAVCEERVEEVRVCEEQTEEVVVREEQIEEVCVCEERIEEAVAREEQIEEVSVYEEQDVTYEKINRHGIAGLPQREWKWANNNFLLHGYTNYKHLMLIRKKDKLYLGVPGVYHNREEVAARSFGFPIFDEIEIAALGLAEEECSRGERFGYWCRPVTERKGVEQRYDRHEYTRKEK